MSERPVLAVAVVALVARAIAAIVLNVTDTWSLAPDSGQYLAVAEAASDGRLEVFWLGYGESLYHSTWAFTAQVTALFEVFGPFRSLGQSVSVAYGVATAAATTAIALRLVRVRFALGAGLLVALAPSQVLWSSVALRESLVWAFLALSGLLLARLRATSDPRWVLAVVVGLGVAYVGLAHLRSQTAFLMLWAAACALALSPGPRRSRVALALLFLVAVPWSVGRGVADLEFLSQSVGRLGTVRTYMAMGAEGAFVASTPYEVDTTPTTLPIVPTVGGVLVPISPTDSPVVTTIGTPAGGSGSGSGPTTTLEKATGGDQTGVVPTTTRHAHVLDRPIEESDDGQKFVIDLAGHAVAVHNDLSASLSAFPRGLVAVSVRPVPWELASSSRRSMAAAESILWLPLILVAVAGAWVRRRDAAVTAFPAILVVAVLASGAVTHGNLGTAFRHRGQILWALAILSAAGAQWWVDRRRAREAG